MKRKLILLAVTIVFLAGFGALLHSPPSMIDAVTGATPKSKKAAQAAAQLEGSYVLGINMMSDGLDNENTRNKLKELALDDSETIEKVDKIVGPGNIFEIGRASCRERVSSTV